MYLLSISSPAPSPWFITGNVIDASQVIPEVLAIITPFARKFYCRQGCTQPDRDASTGRIGHSFHSVTLGSYSTRRPFSKLPATSSRFTPCRSEGFDSVLPRRDRQAAARSSRAPTATSAAPLPAVSFGFPHLCRPIAHRSPASFPLATAPTVWAPGRCRSLQRESLYFP